MEGLEFAGQVWLQAALRDDTATLQCSDEVLLKVAPLILQHHFHPAEMSYVSQRPYGADSLEYCSIRFPRATPATVEEDRIIPSDLNNDDRWAQDEFQIGFQQAPYRNTAMRVLLDSKQDQGLNIFTHRVGHAVSLFGPDFGHIQISDGSPANRLDSFGNLEVTPPCHIAGVDYPFGRIYYGDGGAGGFHMDPEVRSFLERQQVQDPVVFHTGWLWLGHIDELITIVPNPWATHGWSILLASPDYGLATLQGDGVSPGVDWRVHISRYVDFSMALPSGGTYVVNSVGALLNRPLNEPFSNQETVAAYNAGEASERISILYLALADAFGLGSSADILPLPVLFNHIKFVGVTGARAITPDLANGSVFDAVYIAPDQFLRVHDAGVQEEDANQNFQLDAGEDLNGNGLLDTRRDPFHHRIEVDGVMPSVVAVTYIDDWETYHIVGGEVHCSANEVREFPACPKWWEPTVE